MFIVLEIVLAVLYVNATEWLAHRFLLHGVGKRKTSYWAFHWHDHHGAARRKQMVDEEYRMSLIGDYTGKTKEALALLASAVLHLPIVFVAPVFYLTMLFCGAAYYYVHRRSHLDTEWGMKYLPWHYDHHMAPDQDANWCVTLPIFDLLLGTRKRYLGSERWQQDQGKRAALQARKATRATRTTADTRPARALG